MSIRPNSIGLTAHKTWGPMIASPPMLDQLASQGVEHTMHQLPQIVGMGGNASLVCYTSPRTERPVTVFVVPWRVAADQSGEDYYYFEGMTEADAVSGNFENRWAAMYDEVQRLVA